VKDTADKSDKSVAWKQLFWSFRALEAGCWPHVGPDGNIDDGAVGSYLAVPQYYCTAKGTWSLCPTTLASPIGDQSFVAGYVGLTNHVETSKTPAGAQTGGYIELHKPSFAP